MIELTGGKVSYSTSPLLPINVRCRGVPQLLPKDAIYILYFGAKNMHLYLQKNERFICIARSKQANQNSNTACEFQNIQTGCGR